jgi:DNA-directed RNA polymerase subunit RPC12/RpoP
MDFPGEYVCDECGHAETDPESVVCPECGGEMVYQMTPQEVQSLEVASWHNHPPIEDPD